MTDHYDVIVIGSGAGGGTLTHALAPTGKRILLLERGDFLPREPQNWDSRSVWVDLRYHNSGTWTDEATGEESAPKQNYYVGGNTKVYGAILFRFRERDFGEIVHADGISPAWPLFYADFAPYYTRAEHLYHVHGQRGADPFEPPSAAPYRYPPLSHEPRIAQLEADLAKAGLQPFPLPVGLIYDESAPQFSPCIRCATCDGFPCLVNGKADAHVVCVAPALAYPNVTLRTRARVTRLETDGSGRTVTRLVEQLGELDLVTQRFLAAAARWKERDQGIWEIRGEPRDFLYSKLMCWVALDRAIALAPQLAAADRATSWAAARDEIRAAILEHGWSDAAGAYTQVFGSEDLDASNLMLAITGFLPGDDPRMKATIDATATRLTDKRGLVYRYLAHDGLAGEEGTFLLCTFWLAQAQALAGEVVEAIATFERAVAAINDVGLLAEEVEAGSGEMIGNFPQAFSHIGLVNAAWAITQAQQRAAQAAPAGMAAADRVRDRS